MSSTLKRRLSSVSQSISPPPLRRRKLGEQTVSAPASEKHDHLVIYSWNINSVKPLLQKRIDFTKSAIYPLREFLKSHQWPQLLCLQEVKISRTDEKTQQQVQLAANAGSHPGEPMYTTKFSLPRDKFNATGFGGKVHGVATLIRDDYYHSGLATSKPDWDLEGRVLIHEYQLLPLVVINGYWVNGTSNPYRNIDSGEAEGTRHDHKLRFHENMLKLCKKIEESGKSVILIGDMNVAPSTIDGHPDLRTSPVQHVLNRADFNTKFFGPKSKGGLGAVDMFRHLHREAKRFTYHGRGRPWGESCDRVDLVVVSDSAVRSGAIVDCEICDTPQERAHSDHVPLWVSIDPGKMAAKQGKAVEEYTG